MLAALKTSKTGETIEKLNWWKRTVFQGQLPNLITDGGRTYTSDEMNRWVAENRAKMRQTPVTYKNGLQCERANKNIADLLTRCRGPFCRALEHIEVYLNHVAGNADHGLSNAEVMFNRTFDKQQIFQVRPGGNFVPKFLNIDYANLRKKKLAARNIQIVKQRIKPKSRVFYKVDAKDWSEKRATVKKIDEHGVQLELDNKTLINRPFNNVKL